MKEYFNSSIQYYLRHLSNEGCLDPIREIVTDFTKHLSNHISDEQKKYIEDNTINKIKTTKDRRIIEDVLVLIKTIKIDKKVDEKTLTLIEEGLRSLL